jgi:type II secretory pathway component PulF
LNQSLGPFALILLVIPAVALRIAIRALFGRKRLSVADPMQVLLSLASSLMFVLAGIGVITGLLGFWFLFIPLPFIGIILALMLLDRTRRSEHRGLVWALAAAANRGIPLPEAARAYADETLGDTGVRAMALAENLERGQTLTQAARRARLRLGTAMKLAVQLGESLGSLSPAMRQQLDDSQQIDGTLRDAIGRFFYLGTIIIVMNGVCTFVMLKIVPVFQRMFEEFGLKLPAMTILVIDASNWFVNFGWLPIMPFLTLLLPTFLLAALLYYAGWFPRNLPVVWRLFKRYDGALVMRGLALGIRRGMPLPPALRLVAESYPLSIIRWRLRTAAERVEAGLDWCESLRQTGLIAQADAAVLRAAQRAGNLPWALEEMADSALRRQVMHIMAWLQILFPIALVGVGIFVFVFVCGLFLPLISLIQGLT